ncbi:MAG: RHS repeat protein, partial [Chitinophagaceae bacterium]
MRTNQNRTLSFFTGKTIERWLSALLLTATLCTNGQNLNTPNKPGPLGTYVNVLSGNMFVPRTDMVVPGRGFTLNISFYYNSFFLYKDFGFGKGWTFQYNIQYASDTVPGRKVILWGDGRADKYDSLPGGSYKTPRGFFTRLVQYSPGKFRLTEKDSTTYFFDDPLHQKITRMQEPNGNSLQFSYAGGKLASLANNAGQRISFTYDAAGRLAAVTDAVAQPSRTFTYKYDGAGNLIEVKDPLNGTNKYTYLVNGPMKTLADPNGNTIDIIYFPNFTTRELIGCNKRLSFSYDTTQKKTVVTDYLDGGANQVTTYTYQKRDDLSWVTSMSGNCCGFNMTFEYDDQGNKVKETDANGNIYTYTYDNNGNLLTATDPMGSKSTYTYSKDFNQITSYKDPKGNLYTLEYDSKGNMIKLVAPGNKLYSATYNSQGDIVSSTDPKGTVFTYHYDAYGHPASVTGPEGFSATLSHDARGNLLSYVDARGHTRSAEYDILDRLKKITDPINQSMQYSYDAAGNMVSLKNKNNETSLVRYDASSRPVTITGPTGNTTEIGYDAMDNITRLKDPMGRQMELGYDTRNRINRLKNPEGSIATLRYDANGNVTQAVHPNGRTITYTYDKQNRLVKAADANGEISALTYDANGNTTSYRNGTGAVVSFSYDSLNRMVQITDPLGNRTHYEYDKNDNVIALTDQNGFTSHYTYDGMNRVKTFTNNNGFETRVNYDAVGNVASLTDQNNNTTTYAYDELNRRKKMTLPNGLFQQYSYDNKGQLSSKKLTDGSVISYRYDTLGRMTEKTLPGGEVFRFAYDKIGRVTAATNNQGTVLFTYDALSRIASETSGGRTVSYQYNTEGRTQTTTYPDGSIVTKEFDTRNRLIRVLQDSSVLAEYAYNNADQVTAKRLGNGVQTVLQYDGANRLNSLTTASGSIQQLTFTYDKAGNKTAINRENNPSLSETFSYDKGYRLTAYKRGNLQNSYTYDAVGNRTAANLNGVNTTYTVNNVNQLTGKNGIAHTYDNRGNLTFDGQFYKTYDSEGRLVKDSSSPVSVLTYAYDAVGRRVVKTINGQPFTYTYSGAAQIEERDGTNTLLNKTVFTNFLSPLMIEKNGDRFFYHQNSLLSVEAITTGSGRLLESYRYDAYGNPQRYDSAGNSLATSLAGNRVGFTGQEWDSATNSYRFFYRNYSPETGVFNQRDLIEYGDGMGMYQYVRNNPANGVDVWGLATGPDGKPCQDDDEYLFVTEKLWAEEVNIMRERANKLGFVGMLDYAQFDSRFYKNQDGDYARRNAYYFRGDTYESWELNYYFQGMIGKVNTQGVAGSQFNAQAWAATKGRSPSQKTLDMVEMGNNETPAPRSNGWLGRNEIPPMAEQADMMPPDYNGPPVELKVETTKEGIYWPTYNTRTKEFGKILLESRSNNIEEIGIWKDLQWKFWEVDGYRQKPNAKLPPCPPPGGTLDPPPGPGGDGPNGSTIWVLPLDPNEIIGPDGVGEKKWVSVKQTMNYTIRCENDTAASA